MAEKMLNPEIVPLADAGKPVVSVESESKEAFQNVVENILKEIK